MVCPFLIIQFFSQKKKRFDPNRNQTSLVLRFPEYILSLQLPLNPSAEIRGFQILFLKIFNSPQGKKFFSFLSGFKKREPFSNQLKTDLLSYS